MTGNVLEYMFKLDPFMWFTQQIYYQKLSFLEAFCSFQRPDAYRVQCNILKPSSANFFNGVVRLLFLNLFSKMTLFYFILFLVIIKNEIMIMVSIAPAFLE